ncbi:MAG: competence protein ComEA [Chromatiales bacterium]|jgi:competence protein ComEA|nr:competence protein ComEA [Chromatiales bacterium]
MRLLNIRALLAGMAGVLFPVMLLAGPVNVNTADAESISTELKGVGLAKARAIVAYRGEHGTFAAPEELLRVKGIGPKVLRDNLDNILVED